jgi:SSS family solute:Na+ symporter/sodium/proline symporter
MTALYLPAVLIYLAGLAALAVWRSKLVQTGDDFLVAGRTLPARVLLFTLLSTWIGSGSLFAGAGLAYRAGFPALWQPAGAWAGIALIYFIAPRIRRVAGYTVADILGTRFGPPARVLGTLVTVIAYTAIAAYQFRAGGRLLHLISGMDPVTGTLITAAFCIAFTALAGMLSVAALDVANGLMMSVGIGVAAVFLAGRGGGITESLAALRPDQLTLLGSLSPVAALALFLPTMLLLLGEATMYQKFFSAASEAAVRRAVVGWLAGTILVEGLIVALGVFGSTLVPGLTPDASEAIVVRIALDVLPALFAILLLCGAAAIVVSTASSMLLAAATSVATEICRRFVTGSSTDRQVVLCARLGVVGLGVLGIVGGGFFPSILAIALWAYTMYGAGITPALLAALLWPRATRRAGVASIGAGMVTTLVWEAIGLARGPAGDPSYLLGVQTVYPAVVLSVGTLVALSLTSPPDMKQ